MKKTLLKNAIRTIWKNIVPWFAISVVVMLCYGNYFGTFFSARAVRRGLSTYSDTSCFEDFNIMAIAGLKDDELEPLLGLEGINDVEGTWRVPDSVLICRNGKADVDVYGITDRLSLLYLHSGRLPDKDGECALTRNIADEQGIRLGDSIKLYYGGDLPDDLIKSDTFIVTAVVDHPDDLSTSFDGLVFLAEDAFNKEAVDDNYNCIRVDADVPFDADTSFRDYSNAAAAIRDRVRECLGPVGTAHDQHARDEANKKLDDARKEAGKKLAKARMDIKEAEKKLIDAQNKIYDADEKIRDAEKKIADGEKKLKKSEKKLKKSRKKIRSSEKKIRKKEKKLKSSKKKLDKEKKKYNKEKKKLKAARKKLKKNEKKIHKIEKAGGTVPTSAKDQLKAGKKQYRDAKRKLDRGGKQLSAREKEYKRARRKLNRGKDKIRAGKRKLKKGKKELKKARKELAEKKQELEDKKQELAEKKEELEDAKAELADGKQKYRDKKKEAVEKIRDAQKEIDDLKDSAYVFIGRDDMEGYALVKETTNSMEQLGQVFCMIFTIVGAIVILSTIVILIDGDRQRIGTMKSFGFRNREIILGYVIFAGTATIFGMLLSIGLAALLEITIRNSLGMLYTIHTRTFEFDAGSYSILFVMQLILACLIAITGTIIYATRFSAVSLMNGTAGKKTVKKAANSRNRSLYSNLIMRNMRTDLARVVTSVIIIAGSCFVMGVGMTLKDAFREMMPRSADQICHYDMEVNVTDQNGDEGAKYDKVKDFLMEKDITFAGIRKIHTVYRYGDMEQFLNVISGPEEVYNDYIELKDMNGKTGYTPDKDGVLICNRITEKTGLKAGDEFLLYDGDYKPHTIRADHVCQNYLGRIIYLSEKEYQRIFVDEPVNNTFLIRFDHSGRDALTKELESRFSGISVTYTDQIPEKLRGLTSVYNVIVYMMTALSILMSIFVLLNLVNIFINRRQKEVIIMDINGFTWKERKGYLLRESFATTLLGLVLGTAAGYGMTDFLVRLAEAEDCMYVRTFNPKAWIFAVTMEIIFAQIINWIAYRRIKKMDLTDLTN